MSLRKHFSCCDPFLRHKKKIQRGLSIVSEVLRNRVGHPRVRKGDFICVSCRIKLSRDPKSIPVEEEGDPHERPVVLSSSSHGEDDSGSSLSEIEIHRQETETLMPMLGISPLTSTRGKRREQIQEVGTVKLKSATRALKRKLEQSLEVEIPTPGTSPTKRPRRHDTVLDRYEHLMEEIREEFQASTSYNRRLSLLTLSPFQQAKTAEFFGATVYMVKKSREVKRNLGLVPEIHSTSRGRHVGEEEQSVVKRFYESDDVSRMCPGKKDCVSVRSADGVRTTVQKRLMLGNLRELYNLYKDNENNPKIGFSTFAALRPKNCVLVGSSGTHSVCVCVYHQNPALLISALDLPGVTYRDLLSHAVCDVTRRDCMMHACEDCPGENGVFEFLRHFQPKSDRVKDKGGNDSDESSDADLAVPGNECADADDCDDEEIRYKQWVSTDRCTLKDIIETRSECLRTLSNQIVDLTKHDFRAQAQSKYFGHLKETLPAGEVIVHGDFAENFSFVVQDAVQGFHWDSSQCTVHPFIVYWRAGDGQPLSHQSFCVISDGTKHNTAMVHAFLRELMPEVRKLAEGLKKVHYFTDGCAAQYKNRFNFINISHHAHDFEAISCEWNFFATSHGKGACDGIGGTVKRATYHESLKRPLKDQILDAKCMYRFLTRKFVSAIKFLYVSQTTVAKVASQLESRFARAITVKGTKRFHKITPVNETAITVHELSTDEGREVQVSHA